MKRVGIVLLVGLVLIPMFALPAEAYRRHYGGQYGRHHGGFFFGLGVGALLTAPFWYRPYYAYPVYTPVYTYPTYAYPAYAYPPYAYPTYTTPAYTPPATAPSYTTPTPEPLSPPQSGGAEAMPAPQSSSQSCQTVLVEGHYETRVLQSGQRVTAWVPTHNQQVCQ